MLQKPVIGSRRTDEQTGPPGTAGPLVRMPLWMTFVTIGLIILLGLVAWRMAAPPSGRTASRTNMPSGPAPKDHAELEGSYRVDLIAEIPHPAPIACACDKNNCLLVACEDQLLMFSPEGTLLKRVPIEGPAEAVAVAPAEFPLPHHVFIAGVRSISVLSPELAPVGVWALRHEPLRIVALAVGKEYVYVVNGAMGNVLRVNSRGEVVGEFAGEDSARGWPGLILPSLRTDIVVDGEGRVFLANPGLRRVEVYSGDGRLEYFWGKEGSSLPAFFGCCNPQHLALLPNGNLLTSEKGLLRIKEMTPYGEFVRLVAGARELKIFEESQYRAGKLGEPVVVDVAVDSRGNLWLLAPHHPVIVRCKPGDNAEVTK